MADGSGDQPKSNEFDASAWTGEIPAARRYQFAVNWFGDVTLAYGTGMLAAGTIELLISSAEAGLSGIIIVLAIIVTALSAATRNLKL
jgi:hypothetical protein